MVKKYIYITDKGTTVDVSDSILIQDYIKADCIPPTLDVLLDWVSHIKQNYMGKERYQHILNIEIYAVYLLIETHYSYGT